LNYKTAVFLKSQHLKFKKRRPLTISIFSKNKKSTFSIELFFSRWSAVFSRKKKKKKKKKKEKRDHGSSSSSSFSLFSKQVRSICKSHKLAKASYEQPKKKLNEREKEEKPRKRMVLPPPLLFHTNVNMYCQTCKNFKSISFYLRNLYQVVPTKLLL
jgi:hypothetical protein